MRKLKMVVTRQMLEVGGDVNEKWTSGEPGRADCDLEYDPTEGIVYLRRLRPPLVDPKTDQPLVFEIPREAVLYMRRMPEETRGEPQGVPAGLQSVKAQAPPKRK